MIAVFFARYLYTNPGLPSLLAELERRAGDRLHVVDVTSSREDVVRALAKRSRAIVIDQSVYNAATWTEPNVFSPYFILDHKPRSFYQEILGTLLATNTAKLFLTNLDLHDTKNVALFAALKGHVDAITWMFEKRPMAVTDVPPQYRDPWLTADHDPVTAWEVARAAFPVRIELPFALAPHERFATAAGARWEACAPGARYLTRQIARRSLSQARIRTAPARAQGLVCAAAVRVLPRALSPRRATELFIALQNRTQLAMVRGSSTNFVCGGPLAFPVRKFFEIPGAQSAMVAMPCVGFEDYGFRDGHNAIVTAPEDAGAAVRRLLRPDGLRERLVAAAFQTVDTVHSVERRATDLLECVGRLAMGQLRGAQFVNSEFVID